MTIELADGVSYCLLGETAMFLDLSRDRYSGVAARALHNGRAASALIRRGLLVGSGELGSSVRPTRCAAATREAAAFRRAQSGFLARLRAVLAMLSVSVTLRAFGLAATIRRFSPQRATKGMSPLDVGRYQEVLSAFQWVDRLFDQNRACLTRSLALRHILIAHGLCPTLVIGVKLYPFSAHAWLQDQELLVNDSMDRVQVYRPIAVL